MFQPNFKYECNRVIAYADRFASWEDYRQHHALLPTDPTELEELRRLFVKHQSSDGYFRSCALPSRA